MPVDTTPTPITVDKNTVYGPVTVDKKYAPLNVTDLTTTANVQPVPYYSALFSFRNTLFRNALLLPRPLTLLTSNWAALDAAEGVAGRQPPLLVISSGRSGWIREGVNAAPAQLLAYNLVAFTNETDLRALASIKNQSVSPPIYTPLRLGRAVPPEPNPNANRGVYVLVHTHEYRTYRDALAGTGITVVGWGFSNNGLRDVKLVGFGAARFAAIEFAKRMWNNGNRPAWGKAWLLDDGVVRLTGFPGFAAVEQALPATHACAGFKGGTKAVSRLTTQSKALEAIQQNHPVPPLTPATPGIVQQASLWNIAYLQQTNLNFGPAFIASAEDLSMTDYLKANRIPFFFYGGISVVKEEATPDKGVAAQRYARLREQLQRWIAAAEATPGPFQQGWLPPPILVNPTNGAADGGKQLLSEFVINRVIPNSGFKNGGPSAVVTAQCQAVEQINCAALEETNDKGKLTLLSAAALDAVFRVNGQNPQQILTVDVP